MRLLLTIFLASSSFAATLHNSDVTRMVRDGVPVSEMVARINDSWSGYTLDQRDVDSLKRKGVPDLVVKAMFARNMGEKLVIGGANDPQPPTTAALGSRAARRRPIDQTRGEALIVPDATPVRLRLTQSLSSAYVLTEDKIPFEVLEDVVINGRLVIERGAPAWGTITQLDRKKTLGRAGLVEVTIDFVMLANGDKLALKGAEHGARRIRGGLLSSLLVPIGYVVQPREPIWLSWMGRDTVIKDGFDVVVKTDGVANLDSLQFPQR